MRIILKTTLVVLLGVVALIAVIVAWNLLLLGISRLFGFDSEYVKYASWIVMAALLFTPKKYFRIKREMLLSGEIEINAPIEKVWAEVDIRDNPNPYKKSFTAYRAVEGTEDMFTLHFAPVPGDDQPLPEPLLVQRIAASAPNYIAVHHSNSEDTGGLGLGASAEETFLTATGTGTHVRIEERLTYTSLWLLVTMFFVNPVNDTLKFLKLHCEGQEDTSWMAATMDPEMSGGSQSDVMTAGITACIVLTVAMSGIIYAVFWLAS